MMLAARVMMFLSLFIGSSICFASEENVVINTDNVVMRFAESYENGGREVYISGNGDAFKRYALQGKKTYTFYKLKPEYIKEAIKKFYTSHFFKMKAFYSCMSECKQGCLCKSDQRTISITYNDTTVSKSVVWEHGSVSISLIRSLIVHL